jgi:uncharacterized protein YwqG
LLSLLLMIGVFMVIVAFAIPVTSWLNWQKRLRAPRITEAELDSFQARIASAALPVAQIRLVPDLPFEACASRIGGPPYVDSLRRKWPVRGKDRQPMLFLAQINFAELPEMEDFPRKGLLQLFWMVDQDGWFGDLETQAGRVSRWYPDPQGSLTLPVPEVLCRLPKRNALSRRAIRHGLRMEFTPGVAPPNPYNWPYRDSIPDTSGRLPENEEVGRRLQTWDQDIGILESEPHHHWIGGHPEFAQIDVRGEPRLRKLNRVILHLTSDDKDVFLVTPDTELNIMISRKDLRNADFDKAFWTCDFS